MQSSEQNLTSPAGSTKSQGAEPLGLPAPSDASSSTDSNQVIKLDHLGPMIVNSDGTISRIANWQNMTQIEKDRSLRLLAKRNNVRMETLRQLENNNTNPESDDAKAEKQ